MANTFQDYTATAGQTDFAFTFDYLEDEHIKVEINGAETTDFTIVATPSTKVVLDSGATAGAAVRVRRRSAPNQNLVDFVNGSVLTESELDLAYRHNRYLSEEIAELNDQSLQKEIGGTEWDALDLRIQNVGTPTDTTDAVTKIYLDNKVAQVSSGAAQPPLKWVFSAISGTNNTYTVTGAEVLGDTAYEVSIDGLIKEPTVEYTVDPNTDTLTIIPNMTGGEDIVVIQRGFGVAVTGTVGTNSLVDGSVTNAKLAAGVVTADKIEDGAVTSAKTDFNQVIVNNTSGNGRVEVGGTTGAYIDLKTPNTDDYDGRLWIDGDTEALNVIGKHGLEFKIGTNPSTVCTIDSNGDLNITGDYKVNGTNLQTVPTGTVSAFAGSAAPTGYALCDGSAVNRTTQAALFAVIGTTYGIGDGSTTFNLPDLRGRVVAGRDNMGGTSADNLTDAAADQLSGELGSETNSHNHTTTTTTVSVRAPGGGDPTRSPLATVSVDSNTIDIVQPTIILNYIIKT